jgi:hypothetical protein
MGLLEKAAVQGRAAQVDPIKPTLKGAGTKRLKLNYYKLLSDVPFNSHSRRFNKGTCTLCSYWVSFVLRGGSTTEPWCGIPRQGLTLVHLFSST